MGADYYSLSILCADLELAQRDAIPSEPYVKRLARVIVIEEGSTHISYIFSGKIDRPDNLPLADSYHQPRLVEAIERLTSSNHGVGIVNDVRILHPAHLHTAHNILTPQ